MWFDNYERNYIGRLSRHREFQQVRCTEGPNLSQSSFVFVALLCGVVRGGDDNSVQRQNVTAFFDNLRCKKCVGS